MTIKLTSAQRSDVCDLYAGGKSSYYIAGLYGMKPNSIRGVLKRRGVPIRTYLGAQGYDLDSEFFDIIDTEESAYWLGFITADGHIHCDHKLSSYRLKIVLQASDSDHLYKLKKALGAGQPVKIRESEGSAGMAHFTVSSKSVVCDLWKHGLRQRKSTKETVSPSVPPELLRHFFRGYIDGDGSWYFDEDPRSDGKYPAACLSLVGGVEILTSFSLWTARTLRLNPRTLYPHAATWQIRYKGNTQVPILARELYREATVYLERKRSVVAGFLSKEN